MNTNEHEWDIPFGPLIRLWRRITGQRCPGHLVSIESIREGQPLQCARCGKKWAAKRIGDPIVIPTSWFGRRPGYRRREPNGQD